MYGFGAAIITIISGFTIYRFQAGDVSGAAIDFFIVLLVAATLALGSTKRFSGIALTLFGATITTACLLSSLLVSSNGLLWTLLAIVVNTLIVSRRWALTLNALLIVTLSVLGLTESSHLFPTVLNHASWTIIATLIAGFSMKTMDQLRDQRAKLARQASVDPLTGTGNRRLMVQHLEALVSERRSGQRVGTLMVFDIDHFKQVNDVHGHNTGDQVLIDFVRVIESSLRSNDGLYRMGGEEFVLLLRGMDESIAETYLPDLHQRLTGKVSTPSGPVAFSAGAASLHEGEEWSAWLARADRALYTAKSSGRNRLCFAE